jgi:hypothetical protein
MWKKSTRAGGLTAIAKESKTLVVIGHYYSSISLEGGKIYKEYGIPAITASATAPEVTEGNGWYFRVVPDTNLQGKFSALYIKNILEHEAANIVFEQSIAYRIFWGPLSRNGLLSHGCKLGFNSYPLFFGSCFIIDKTNMAAFIIFAALALDDFLGRTISAY